MTGPRSVEDYLAALPDESRVALEALRSMIHAIAPTATEVISYQMPTFKYEGHSLVAYAAFKDHCSLFPMSVTVVEMHLDELRPFLTGKATIRFLPGAPLPAGLVEKIVKARMAENAARTRTRQPRRARG